MSLPPRIGARFIGVPELCILFIYLFDFGKKIVSFFGIPNLVHPGTCTTEPRSGLVPRRILHQTSQIPRRRIWKEIFFFGKDQKSSVKRSKALTHRFYPCPCLVLSPLFRLCPCPRCLCLFLGPCPLSFPSPSFPASLHRLAPPFWQLSSFPPGVSSPFPLSSENQIIVIFG